MRFPVNSLDPSSYRPDYACRLRSPKSNGQSRCWTWLHLVLCYLLLPLVTLTYTACPVVAARTKGASQNTAAFAIALAWFLSSILGGVASMLLGGRCQFWHMFDFKRIVRLSPAGGGYAVADVCEILAVAHVDPVTYAVVSQLRLVLTAAAQHAILGRRRGTLQWGILSSLTLVLAAYCTASNAVAGSDSTRASQGLGDGFVLGVSLTLMKVCLSVGSSVYAEARFADSGAEPLHVQMGQMSFSSAAVALMGCLTLTDPASGNPFSCPAPSSFVPSLNLFVLAATYCWREWICNACIRQYGSLAKNMCNAVSMATTYIYSVMALGAELSSVRVLLLLAAFIEVVNYLQAEAMPKGAHKYPNFSPKVSDKVASATKLCTV